jgi:hypothetical protein
VVAEIRLYVEGGNNSESRKDFRKGLRTFLKELDELAKERGCKLELIFCGNNQSTHEDFKRGLDDHPWAFNALLVDADHPVTDESPWAHLKMHLGWDAAGTDDSHCHLMAQAIEAWLIADVEKLKEFYGRDFNAQAIPRAQDVEQVEKSRLEAALDAATRRTSKGKYHKTRHAPKLLGMIEPRKVREAARHCERLFVTLEEKLKT